MSAPMPVLVASPVAGFADATAFPSDFGELLRHHEGRQALVARAAHSLLRIAAATPPDNRLGFDAVGTGRRATAWLAGCATNPGRWASRSVLTAELRQLDSLLIEVQVQLGAVLSWVSSNLGSQVTGPGAHQTIRVPRTLLAECTTLLADLTGQRDPRTDLSPSR